jgi:hypothetical protein
LTFTSKPSRRMRRWRSCSRAAKVGRRGRVRR